MGFFGFMDVRKCVQRARFSAQWMWFCAMCFRRCLAIFDCPRGFLIFCLLGSGLPPSPSHGSVESAVPAGGVCRHSAVVDGRCRGGPFCCLRGFSCCTPTPRLRAGTFEYLVVRLMLGVYICARNFNLRACYLIASPSAPQGHCHGFGYF